MFEATWNALQANLTPGTVIPNGTAYHGAFGEPFTVAAVGATIVVVDPPGAQTEQRVGIADFRAVYDHWNNYCHGPMLRRAFRPLTRYSKYVISILHWLEGHLGGQLP